MWKGITLLLLVGISFWDSDVYALQGATPNDIPETILVWTEHPFGSGKYGTTSMPFESDYLKGVVFQELNSYPNGYKDGKLKYALSPLEALKSQAVVARSYFLGRSRRLHRDFNKHISYGGNTVDTCDSQMCQDYKKYIGTDLEDDIPNVGQAVDETKGIILLYFNSNTKKMEAIQSEFAHACDGNTVTAPKSYPGIGPTTYFKSVKCQHYVPHVNPKKGEYLAPENAHQGGLRGLCQQGAVAFALGTNKVAPGENWNYLQILQYYYSLDEPVITLAKLPDGTYTPNFVFNEDQPVHAKGTATIYSTSDVSVIPGNPNNRLPNTYPFYVIKNKTSEWEDGDVFKDGEVQQVRRL